MSGFAVDQRIAIMGVFMLAYSCRYSVHSHADHPSNLLDAGNGLVCTYTVSLNQSFVVAVK
eukprot:565115-Rhodomonas_salina.1